ncbi:MAG: response regulator [Bacteroidales bacterium]|jgi:signal transduction histidine kinase|nr:response regulator [Bacteroidales bacterium]
MGKYKLSVLIVEDDKLSLFMYTEFLKSVVSEVYSASNGFDGIRIFRKYKPDIVITDIMMPRMDGLEMIKKIKDIDPGVKAIMISGHSDADYFIRSIDLGVDAYLLKPVDNQKLKRKIGDLGENIMLSNKVAEKERAEKILIKAKEKAEEADQLKGVFLANISHEIQTPIKAIISFSNLLKSNVQDEKRREELISIIESNSNSLLNLTNDILEFTRLQSKTVKLFNISFELNLFLKEMYPVFESLRRRQSENSIPLRFANNDDTDQLMISSDPSRLRQVFTNLISNAFKFTHKGYIEYGYKLKKRNDVVFFVKDTGLGISRDYQKKIFERFIQEPNPTSVKREGTGLGLPISRSLVSMLGGKIWVESEPGEGSTFWFELPGIVLRKEKDAAEKLYEWKDREVLIIEDEIRSYISIEEVLKNRLRINYIDNPEQAMEFCTANKAMDLCLIKWHPDIKAEYLRELRKLNSSSKIIALLDRGLKSQHKDFINKHFDDSIVKPYKREKILKTLDKFLA